MSNRAQDVLADVLLGDLGVCPDVEAVREAPSLRCAWNGALDYALDPKLWGWFVDTFIDDVEERARIYRGMGAIRQTFLDIAKLHHAQTGEATVLPERLIRTLQMRVAAAMRPSAYEIGIGATGHAAVRASANLKRLTTEASWQERS